MKDNIIVFPEKYNIGGFQEVHRNFIIPYASIGETAIKFFSFPDNDNPALIIEYPVVRINMKNDISRKDKIYLIANDIEEACEIEWDLKKIRMSNI